MFETIQGRCEVYVKVDIQIGVEVDLRSSEGRFKVVLGSFQGRCEVGLRLM